MSTINIEITFKKKKAGWEITSSYPFPNRTMGKSKMEALALIFAQMSYFARINTNKEK